jgi:hypothetical protein
MARSTIMTAVVTSLAVALASGPVLADPGNGKGQGQGQGHGKGQAPHAQGQGNSGGHKQSAGGNDWHGGPSIDRGDVLGILGGHRNYWSPGPALPPGIQKNLARGKPCHLVSPRNWMAVCWGSCLTTTGMSGCKRAQT